MNEETASNEEGRITTKNDQQKIGISSSSSSESWNNNIHSNEEDSNNALDLVISISEETDFDYPTSPEGYYPDANKEPLPQVTITTEDNRMVTDISNLVATKKMTAQTNNNTYKLPPRIQNVAIVQQHQQQQQHMLFYDSDGETSAGSNASLIFINPMKQQTPQPKVTIPNRKYMPFFLPTETKKAHHERQNSWGSLNSSNTNNSSTGEPVISGPVPTTIITESIPSSEVNPTKATSEDEKNIATLLPYHQHRSADLDTEDWNNTSGTSTAWEAVDSAEESPHDTNNKKEGHRTLEVHQAPETVSVNNPSKVSSQPSATPSSVKSHNGPIKMPPRRPTAPQPPSTQKVSHPDSTATSTTDEPKIAPRLTDYLSKDITQYLQLNISPKGDGNKNVAKQKQEFHERNQAFLKQQQRVSPSRNPITTLMLPPASPSSLFALNNRISPHRRLSSIDNDNWEEADEEEEDATQRKKKKESSGHSTENTQLSSYNYNSNADYGSTANTSVFLSSSSSCTSTSSTPSPRKKKKKQIPPSLKEEETNQLQSPAAKKNAEKLRRKMERKSILKFKKSMKRLQNSYSDNQHQPLLRQNSSSQSIPSSSSSEDDEFYNTIGYKEALLLKKAHKRALKYEAERSALIEQWKAEARAEAELLKAEEEYFKWYNRLYRWILSYFNHFSIVLSNLPSTIGGIALAVTTLGIVWFKFAEENIKSCHPVHYHSSQCQFAEFPGCFYCSNLSDPYYQFALGFHYICTFIGGVLALCLVSKIFLAWRVVLDELSSPITCSPAGLMCMTMVCVSAIFGDSGKMLVVLAAFVHLCLVIWFNYMALAYRILPDPSWWPNTVGVGLSAVKTWMFYPWAGHFLMALSLGFNIIFFPVSVIRVFVNEKISATVCWIQMSAPAISLYALTIMAQPSFEEEQPDVSTFDRIHRAVYLPVMHMMFVLAIIGVISGVHSLWVRWPKMKSQSFSPAFAAFPFPLLAQVNAIQAYRGAVENFSNPPVVFKFVLFVYWLFMLLVGTLVTVIISGMYLYYLPRWTNVDLTDEVEPPAPNATVMSEIINEGFFEGIRHHFVSPAVLQANETGVLVRDSSNGLYVRTRRIPALGFDPTMNWSEMNEAREALLQWVAKNPPRHRHNTLSVPGIHVQGFGRGNTGVYNDLEADLSSPHHPLGAASNSFVNNRPRASSSDAFFRRR